MGFTSTKSITVLCRAFLSRPGLRARLPCMTISANICSKENRDPNYVKPKPWPYEKRKYRLHHMLFDGTSKRFDENSKIIVVEGNIGSGKTAFAKELAETFDMKYIPEPDMEATYITPYGYDLRLLDDVMPPSFKSIYINKFYKNPYDRNVPRMQFRMLSLRCEAYIDALAHLLNTGQGVVMERCVYSDFVFLEAMTRAGYIKRPLRDYYMEIYEYSTEFLLRPHLIIYLDVEPKTALSRIKERNKEPEVNSTVLTEKYLSDIEFFYKQRYLKEFRKHSELLVYDWNHFGDMEVVVEDLEKLDFSRFGKFDSQLRDWRYLQEDDLCCKRREYTSKKGHLLQYTHYFRYEHTEVMHEPYDIHNYINIMKKVPGAKYSFGFNKDQGDSYLFKLKSPPPQIGDRFRMDQT